MADEVSTDGGTEAGELTDSTPADSEQQEVTSPELEHLQHTIDGAKDAAKAALSDQPDI